MIVGLDDSIKVTVSYSKFTVESRLRAQGTLDGADVEPPTDAANAPML